MLSTAIARQIRRFIEESDCQTLPSLAVLAARHGVSRTTLQAAIAQLHDEGVVLVRRGSRIRVASRSRPVEAPREAAEERVYHALREQICTGAIPVGQRMPKIAVCARQLGTSNRTVEKALVRLAAARLIHRAAKWWVAGPQTPEVRPGPSFRPPVILVLLKDQNSWRFLGDTRTRGFRAAFELEAARMKVQLIPAFYWTWPSFRGSYTSGLNEVITLARELGDRYLGTLAIDSDLEQIRDGLKLLERLCGLGRPVVWFDRNDRPPPQPITAPQFIRCHYAERPAIVEAASFLSVMGHAEALYPCLDSHEQWRLNRLRLLSEAGARLTPPLRVTGVFTDGHREHRHGLRAGLAAFLSASPPSRIAALLNDIPGVRAIVREFLDTDFGSPDQCSLLAFAKMIGRTIESGEAYTAAALIAYTGLMQKCVAARSATVLIAPNDQDALFISRWLHTMRIEVPRRFSIISFDNYLEFSLYPITTVDFGFGGMGYAAFHAITGDIPVARRNSGEIVSRPEIIRRGSVAPVQPRPASPQT